MCEYVLKIISKLESVDVIELELNVGVNNEFGEMKNFLVKVESVIELRFFLFFGCKSFNGFEVEIVIKMEVIEVFLVDKKVEYVVILVINLKIGFYLVKSGGLEKFGVF